MGAWDLGLDFAFGEKFDDGFAVDAMSGVVAVAGAGEREIAYVLLGAAEPVGEFAPQDRGAMMGDDGVYGDSVEGETRGDDAVLDAITIDADYAAGVGGVSSDVDSAELSFVEEVEDVLRGAVVEEEGGLGGAEERPE